MTILADRNESPPAEKPDIALIEAMPTCSLLSPTGNGRARRWQGSQPAYLPVDQRVHLPRVQHHAPGNLASSTRKRARALTSQKRPCLSATAAHVCAAEALTKLSQSEGAELPRGDPFTAPTITCCASLAWSHCGGRARTV